MHVFDAKIRLLRNPNIILKFNKTSGFKYFLDYGSIDGAQSGRTDVSKPNMSNIKKEWYTKKPKLTDYY